MVKGYFNLLLLVLEIFGWVTFAMMLPIGFDIPHTLASIVWCMCLGIRLIIGSVMSNPESESNKKQKTETNDPIRWKTIAGVRYSSKD